MTSSLHKTQNLRIIFPQKIYNRALRTDNNLQGPFHVRVDPRVMI